MPSYVWECTRCKRTESVLREMKDIDIPPTADGECDHEWSRLLFAPRVLKESWPDGHRLKHDQSYANIAKAAQLEVDKLDYRENSVERKEMQAEIHRLKGVKTPEGAK